jgi:hypothetical protein
VVVTVKNVGKASAATSQLALYQVGSTPGYLMNALGPYPTPTIAAGQTATVQFGCNNNGKALFIVAVDVPVAGSPLGQVAETPIGERNNTFGFPFDADLAHPVQTHLNPAVK